MKIDSRSTLKQHIWRSDAPTVGIRIPIGPAQLLSLSLFFFPTSHLEADLPRHPEPWIRRRGSVRPQTYQQASKEFRTHEKSPAHDAMSTSVLSPPFYLLPGPYYGFRVSKPSPRPFTPLAHAAAVTAAGMSSVIRGAHPMA